MPGNRNEDRAWFSDVEIKEQHFYKPDRIADRFFCYYVKIPLFRLGASYTGSHNHCRISASWFESAVSLFDEPEPDAV